MPSGSEAAGIMLTGFVLIAALLLGGGTRYGVPNDSLIELASLPLLGFGLFGLSQRPVPPRSRPLLLLIACAALLVLLQLVPLPPALWPHLPGRAPLAETYTTAGIPVPWMPISLDPSATIRAALSLLPGLAVFLGVISLRLDLRRALCLIVIALAFFNVLFGLTQLMEGSDSGLYFFEYTNTTSAVGLFGNRNHFSALLYSAVPLLAAWAASLVYKQQLRQAVAVAMGGVAYCAMVIGLAAAQSRAGLILGLVAGAASLAMIWPRGLTRSRTLPMRVLAVGGLSILVLSQIVLVLALGERATLGDATRLQMARITFEAALAYFPLGSGFGTFVPVFGMFQGPASAFMNYVNHAHDDWLELWLEGGVPAALLMLAFLAWYVSALRPIWRRNSEEPLQALLFRRSGSIVIALLLLHSLVDYPLRTIAMACVFALACGLVTAPPDPIQDTDAPVK